MQENTGSRLQKLARRIREGAGRGKSTGDTEAGANLTRRDDGVTDQSNSQLLRRAACVSLSI